MEFEDPELQELSKCLPHIVMRGKAPATTKKYTGAFLRWKRWASQRKGIDVVPVNPFHLSLYLGYLIQKSASVAPVEEAVHALSWVHTMALEVNPTEHELVQQVLAGAKHILAKATTKKEPITVSILQSLVDECGGREASLADVRTLAICLVSFAGVFRYDEIVGLKESDIEFFADHVEIFIESSKTDQFRDGARVVIARTHTQLCPVNMLERYVKMADIQGDMHKHLFRGLVVTKAGAKLRTTGGLSYTRVRELVLEKLTKIGLDASKFGLHSLRAGGASAAANAGIPDRWFKRHGRWRSENAKDGYVKDCLEDRLQVSRNLGL